MNQTRVFSILDDDFVGIDIDFIGTRFILEILNVVF